MILRRGLIALLALYLWPSPLQADPLIVRASALDRFALLTNSESFGALDWRGGLELNSNDRFFGGFSGLTMSADCQTLTAVSDSGRWLHLNLSYTDGRLTDVTKPELARIRDANGKPFTRKWSSDAEAITDMGNGQFAIAFEGSSKVGSFDVESLGFAAPFKDQLAPKEISKGPSNGQVEALAYFKRGPHAGHFMAVAERHVDAKGNTKAWLWKNKNATAFSIAKHGDYLITDLAISETGDMFFLERNISVSNLPAMAIRFLPAQEISAGTNLQPRLIFEAKVPFHAIDNMEGLSLCTIGDEQRITLLSDNNFTSLQRTLLLQFTVRR